MSYFNYLSSQRSNCTPVEGCNGNTCHPITECGDLLSCLNGTSGLGGWIIGADVIATVAGVENDNCGDCTDLNGARTICTAGNVSFDGCSAQGWVGPLDPCAHAGGDLDFFFFLGVTISLGGLYASLGNSLSFANYSVSVDDDPTVLDRFCAGEEVELALSSSGGEPGFDPDCDFSGSTVTVQKIIEPSCSGPFDPTGNCDGLIDCEAMPPIIAILAAFQNCDYTGSEPDLGDYTGHSLLANLNKQYELFNLNSFSTYDSECLGTLATGEFAFIIPLGRTDEADYDDPGILIDSRNYTDNPTFHWEKYAWALYVVIKCDSGAATIKFVAAALQLFSGLEGVNWPPAPNGGTDQPCIIWDTPPDHGGTHVDRLSGDCHVGGMMQRIFLYDYCGDDTKFFYVGATL